MPLEQTSMCAYSCDGHGVSSLHQRLPQESECETRVGPITGFSKGCRAGHVALQTGLSRALPCYLINEQQEREGLFAFGITLGRM